MKDVEVKISKFGIKHIGYFTKVWNKVNDFDWWKHQHISEVLKIKNLIAIQNIVTVKGLFGADDNPEFIKVVRIGKKLYIRDGHHRVVVAKLYGQAEITASVVTL